MSVRQEVMIVTMWLSALTLLAVSYVSVPRDTTEMERFASVSTDLLFRSPA